MPSTEPDTTAPGPAPDRSTDRSARRGLPGGRLLLALLLIVVVTLVILGGTTRGRVISHKVVRVARDVTGLDGGPPKIIDDASVKADMLEKLPYKPELIILGGSRGMRIETSYLKHKTGLDGFNAGVPNERPEEAWAMTHFAHDLNPDVRPRYLWPIHVKFLRTWAHVTPSLVNDPRLSRYFPAAFLDQQRDSLPRKYLAGGGTLRLTDPARYGPDGRVTIERDWTQAHVDMLIERYTKRWIKKFGPGSPTIDERCREYFEKTLGYMNELGARPVLVLMPIHPRMMAEVDDQGWLEARKDLMSYFTSLKPRYDFTVIDLSRVESFGGDPDGFYDGYHPRVENQRLVIDEILRRYPHAFD